MMVEPEQTDPPGTSRPLSQRVIDDCVLLMSSSSRPPYSCTVLEGGRRGKKRPLLPAPPEQYALPTMEDQPKYWEHIDWLMAESARRTQAGLLA